MEAHRRVAGSVTLFDGGVLDDRGCSMIGATQRIPNIEPSHGTREVATDF
jgi:hypothetical protein